MITNDPLLIEQYYDRGILKKEIRSYEVSLWTLQDEFITVLKWSDVEQKGRIENPKMILNIDGTEKFDFSIPMYYRLDGQLIENPNWYSFAQKKLLVNLNKLKVIFNKGDEEKERVFEFVIVNVAETHENDVLTCNVKAEGLAFQELGQRGYKYSLSSDMYEIVRREWEETGEWTNRKNQKVQSEPLFTLSYWCEEGLGIYPLPENNIQPNTWYYAIKMNQKSFVGGAERDSNKVYEEPYVSSWNNTTLAPETVQNYREKERIIEVKNSNIYNITQTMAEKFEVFCRYEYGYDENYHIISRTIVFYNNFIQEEYGTISFTYPYSSSSVSREIDSADTKTKLFVLDVENNATLEGYNSIVNSPANASMEDYILNFDYMLQIGAINQDQYDQIKPYEIKMRSYNQQLKEALDTLTMYENQISLIRAKKETAERSEKLAKERIDDATFEFNSQVLDDDYGDGLLTKDANNPDRLFVLTNSSNVKYVDLTNTTKGIQVGTIKVYKDYTNYQLSQEITSFKPIYDDYGNVTGLQFSSIDVTFVYLTYTFDPKTYYQNIINVWNNVESTNAAQAQELTDLLNDLEQKAESANASIQALKTQKEEAIQKFEYLMGPAIREGYWQPEDYSDYGDHLSTHGTLQINTINNDAGNDAIIAWDTNVFETEEQSYYEAGVNKDQQYYPCLDLTTIFTNGIPTNLDDYSVIWKTNRNKSSIAACSVQDLRVFTIGSQALVRFIKRNNTIVPVLLLTGAKSLTEDQIVQMKSRESNGGQPRLAKYSTRINGNQIEPQYADTKEITSGMWITFNTNTQVVYPRIKFSSLALKTDTNNLVINYDGNLLSVGYDYFINIRNNDQGKTETYIRIKPESLIKYGYAASKQFNVSYVLSNANTAMYLDALQVSKENAQPKVSYNVTANILNTDLSNILYNMMARIVMINDTELKFEDVFGYISQIELDLDHVYNDKIEVKNYKTKFEDLFSTIVAQTEEMKRAGSNFNAAVNGKLALDSEGLAGTLADNTSIMEEYLNSYFDSSRVVRDRLTSLFTEAGEILGDSNKTLTDMRALTLENAEILSGFAQSVSSELTAKVYRGTKPINYKPGDIWIDDEGNRYVATGYSIEGGSKSTSGFVRTYDGTLAQINGAALDINSADGEIKIKAVNNVDIASADVNIVGNHSVNIGGTQINIGSTSGSSDAWGGINLVASSYDNINVNGNVSKVLINPEKIEMGAAELELKASSQINLITSAGLPNSTAAVHMSAEDGIWIGTGSAQGIRLFSGEVKLNNNGTINTNVTNSNGATVELNSQHLIFGFANVNSNNSTAVELTESHVIIAAGGNLHYDDWISSHSYAVGDIVKYNNEYYRCNTAHTSANSWSTNETKWTILNTDGTTYGLVGARFTKESIGLAVQSSNVITAMVMDKNGFTVGSGVNVASNDLRTASDSNTSQGSYTRISKEGIELGSFADLYINTNNFKLQTHSRDQNNTNFDGQTVLAIGNGLQNINYSTDIRDGKLYNGNTLLDSTNIRLVVNKNGLFINGNGNFTGSVIASTFIAVSNNGKFVANGDQFGLYKTDNSAILTVGGNALTVNGNYTLSVDGDFKIDTTTFTLDTNPSSSSSPMFELRRASDDNIPYFTFSQQDGLTVAGNIIASSLTAQSKANGNLAFRVDDTHFGFYDTRGTITNTNDDISLLEMSSDGLLCQSKFVVESNDSIELKSNNGSINFGVHKFYQKTTLPSVNDHLIGDLVYCSNGSSKGLYELTKNGSTLQWTKLSSGDEDSEEVQNILKEKLRNSFLVTDEGWLVCERITCRAGIFGEIVGSADEANIPSTCSCGSGCASTCTGSCGDACSNSCTNGCYGSCGSGCSNGCGGSCGGSCGSGCGTACANGCGTACSQGCSDGCTSSCGGECSTGCKGLTENTTCDNCNSACTTGCTSGCTAQCTNACGTECANSCNNGCTEGCTSNCGGACMNDCTDGCDNTCTGGCTGSCTLACSQDCYTGCGNACAFNCYTVCTTSCKGGCQGQCTAICTNSNS